MSNDSTFTGTFNYVVDKYMDPNKKIYSKPYTIGPFFWKIMVEKKEDMQTISITGKPKMFNTPKILRYLEVFLECDHLQAYPTWKCLANVTLSIVSLKLRAYPDAPILSYTSNYLFSQENNRWGVRDFMRNGSESNYCFYEQDDNIVIRAHIEIGILLDSSPTVNPNLNSKSTNEALPDNASNTTTVKEPIVVNEGAETGENEKKIKSLEAELSQLMKKFVKLEEKVDGLEEKLKTGQ